MGGEAGARSGFAGGAAGSGGAGGVPRSITWVSTGSQASGGVASAQGSDGSVVVLPSVAPRCCFSSASILFNKGLSLMGSLLAGGLTQVVCFQGIAARLIETVTGAAPVSYAHHRAHEP